MSGDMHVPGEGMIWAPSGNAGRSWVVQKRPCSRVVTSFSSTPSCRPGSVDYCFRACALA